MCILSGILEIARNHYFYPVEREDENEAAKQSSRKSNQFIKYFSTKGRKLYSEKVEKKLETHTYFLTMKDTDAHWK